LQSIKPNAKRSVKLLREAIINIKGNFESESQRVKRENAEFRRQKEIEKRDIQLSLAYFRRNLGLIV